MAEPRKRNLSEEIELTLKDLPVSMVDNNQPNQGQYDPKHPNLSKTADYVARSLMDGLKQEDGSVRPVRIDQLRDYLNSKGFPSIKVFVESLGKAYDITVPIQNGLMFGLKSEIQAGVESLYNGKNYRENYRDRILQSKLYEMENPNKTMVGEVAGGLSTGIPVGMALEKQLAKTALGSVQRNLKNPLTYAGKSTPAMTAGLAEGAVVGFGTDTQDTLTRLYAMLTGMGMGLGMTTGTMALVGVLSELKKYGSRLIGRGTGERGEELVYEGLEQDQLLETLDDGTVSAQPAIDKLQKMENIAGDDLEVIPADLGPNMQSRAGVVLNTPSGSRKEAIDFVEGRQEGQLDRFIGKIEEGAGLNREDLSPLFKETKEQQLKTSRKAYAQAYAEGVQIDNPTINKYVNSPWFQKAYLEGAELARLEKSIDRDVPDIPFPNPKLDEFGEVIMKGDEIQYEPISGPFSLAQLDYVKRGFGDFIDKMKEKGSIGKGRKGVYKKTIVDFVNALDEEVPSYKVARDLYGDSASADDAFDEGLKYARTRPRKIKAILSDMTTSEKFYYRLGAVESLIDQIEVKGEGADLSLFFKKNRQAKQRLQMLFDNDEQFDKFIEYVNVERQGAMTRKAGAGSNTEDKIEARRQFIESADSPVMDIFGDIMTYGPSTGLKANFAKQIQRRTMGVNPNVADTAGSILFNRDRNLRERMIEDMVKKVPKRREAKRAGRRNVTAGTAGGFIVPTGLLSEELSSEYYP